MGTTSLGPIVLGTTFTVSDEEIFGSNAARVTLSVVVLKADVDATVARILSL